MRAALVRDSRKRKRAVERQASAFHSPKTKMNDRRYAFMYQAPEEYEAYEALHVLANKLLGTGNVQGGINSGIKIIDFSEVPGHSSGRGGFGRAFDLPDPVLEQSG